MIAQHFILFECHDTLPFIVYNSIEREVDPCKSDLINVFLRVYFDVFLFFVFSNLGFDRHYRGDP